MNGSVASGHSISNDLDKLVETLQVVRNHLKGILVIFSTLLVVVALGDNTSLLSPKAINWPKLFQAFSVKFTLIFYHECVHSIIPHQHM